MITLFKDGLWKQFGASIDMLKNAILQWPEEHWHTRKKFFYNAYHCLIFLDYYLNIPAEILSSQLPFTFKPPSEIPEDAIDDIIPDRIYSKKEMLDYLQFCREKCCNVINGLTEEELAEHWIEVDGRKNFQVLELLLYNMRHVQHHAAQLNMILRQEIGDAPRWVRRVNA